MRPPRVFLQPRKIVIIHYRRLSIPEMDEAIRFILGLIYQWPGLLQVV